VIIDVHCHYSLSRRLCREPEDGPAPPRFSFEPSREADGSPGLDACVSPRAARRPAWRGLQWLLGIDLRLRPGDELDRRLEAWNARHLLAEGPIERHVLLAFDWYHHADGSRPALPSANRALGSDLYASNSFVLDLCRRHPQRYLFGASVHPYRRDAVACLDEVFAAGACLLKWLPLHQNIDVHDPRTLAVLRRCAALGLPVLAHYGQEFTLRTQHPEFESVTGLLDALRRLRAEGAMPTTIVAHVSTPVSPFADLGGYRALLDALLGEFADAPLYADISALTAIVKLRFLRDLARRQELHGKLLFGTDFPIPSFLPGLRRDLGRDYRHIAAEPSWTQRMVHVARRLGFNEIVFHRAAELLPHVRGAAEAAGGAPAG
jgi:predicted TIM-barrel fold metal-dependent hydrolase